MVQNVWLLFYARSGGGRYVKMAGMPSRAELEANRHTRIRQFLLLRGIPKSEVANAVEYANSLLVVSPPELVDKWLAQTLSWEDIQSGVHFFRDQDPENMKYTLLTWEECVNAYREGGEA